MSKVRFGVVGFGHIGVRHVQVIEQDENAELVAVGEIDEEKRKKLQEMMPDVHVYSDYLKMVDVEELDVVSICTPHGLHYEMSLELSRKKIHSLVEKPMALSSDQCDEMIRVAIENEVKVFVVKQNRYNKPIALTKSAIDVGKLGKLFMCQCNVFWNRQPEYYKKSNWRGSKELEGGALFTQVSHFIDLLIWYMGDLQDARTYIDTLYHQIGIEDTGVSILKFQSGALGSLNWTNNVYNINYEGSLTFFGEKGTIKIGGKYLNKIDFWDVQGYPMPEQVDFDDKPNDYGAYKGSSSNHDKVISAVSRKLLDQRIHVVEGDEGIKTIQAIEKIYSNG